MPNGTKIATCSYCGTRAALVLAGRVRHELACATCGAPLHEIKSMPLRRQEARKPLKQNKYGALRTKAKKPRKTPKRKSGMRHFLGEAFDILEDIFD